MAQPPCTSRGWRINGPCLITSYRLSCPQNTASLPSIGDIELSEGRFRFLDTRMRKLLKEPILHFLLIGTLLYFAYTSIASRVAEKEKEIVVSAAQIELLAENFSKTWFRAPTQSELEAQIQNRIMDEVLYREAVAMELDKNDDAVKRRLRQLMDFMLNDYATVYPTERQLQSFLDDHAERFRTASIISFEQIYFESEAREAALNMLSRLQAGHNVQSGQQLSLLPSQLTDESERQVEARFGRSFTESVFALEVGTWHGPIESAYGLHLVNVQRRTEGEKPPLAEVRDQVEREWSIAQQRAMKEQMYEQLRARYSIVVEMPPTAQELPTSNR